MKMKGIANLEAKVANVVEEANELKKQLATLQSQMLALKANDLENTIEECNGHKLLFANLSGADGNALKDIANNLKAKYEDIVVFLASASEDKITFVAAAGKAAVANGVKCGDLVRQAAMICDGKGGGRPDLAQSGGKDPSKCEEAMKFVKNMLS